MRLTMHISEAINETKKTKNNKSENTNCNKRIYKKKQRKLISMVSAAKTPTQSTAAIVFYPGSGNGSALTCRA